MKWPAFAIALYILLALQISIASALRLEIAGSAVEPRLLLVLLVFVGLSAPPRVVMIAAGVMGFFLDATTTWPTAGGATATLLGPYALGYMAGGLVLLQVRPMVFRQHALAYAFMILAAGVAVHLVVVAIFAIRIWYDPVPGFSATSELFVRLLTLLYSAAFGAALSVPLVLMSATFGFTPTRGRRR